MNNPFILPRRGRRDHRPLNPSEVEEHEDYYVPVDSTLEEFKRFKENMADVDVASVGQFVLIGGQEGTGKSALIYRCANWLRKTLAEEQGLDAKIVDFLNEKLAGMGADDQAEELYKLIKGDVTDLFPSGDLENLQSKESLVPAIRFLSNSLLSAHNKCLILLFPPLETYEVLRSYLTFARAKIVVFCESAYDQVVRSAERAKLLGDPISLLSVGLLATEDGWSFAKSRLELWAARNGGAAPSIKEETVRRFMEDREKGRGGTNIRELQMTLMAVFDEALKNQAPVVEYQDFRDYYMQKAVLS
jgi:hypothetical protein